jgi:hypothetical protein
LFVLLQLQKKREQISIVAISAPWRFPEIHSHFRNQVCCRGPAFIHIQQGEIEISIFTAIGGAFKKLWKIIISPAAQRAIESAVDLVPIALPIVQEIRTLDPKTATIADVVAMYQKYRVTLAGTLNQDPVSIGNALLNLATALVKLRAPSKTTSIVQTAIQLALVALKAK